MTTIYTLENFNKITADSFNFTIHPNILKIISNLSTEVGSPTYIKTPIFKKRDFNQECSGGGGVGVGVGGGVIKKKRGNKELNDLEWEKATTLQQFKTTKFDEKNGLEVHIDNIRSNINKMTDLNYDKNLSKIFDIIDLILFENETEKFNENDEIMIHIGKAIFDVASTNRYYSKLYAKLYSELITKYEIIRNTIKNSLDSFNDLFNNIEYVDPVKNYDKFCKINKDNEKRKALSTFYYNLMKHDIISKQKIVDMTRHLLNQFYTFVSEENKKNEVDELIENIVLLFDKELYNLEYELIDDYTIVELLNKFAISKSTDYPSLTTKTIFKIMDILGL